MHTYAHVHGANGERARTCAHAHIRTCRHTHMYMARTCTHMRTCAQGNDWEKKKKKEGAHDICTLNVVYLIIMLLHYANVNATLASMYETGHVSKAAAQRELVKSDTGRHSTITGLFAEGARTAADTETSATKYLAMIKRLKLARDALTLPAAAIVDACLAMRQQHPEHTYPAQLLSELWEQERDAVAADALAAAVTMLLEKHPEVAAGHAGAGYAMAAGAAGAPDLAGATASFEKALELDRNNLTAIIELAKMASAAKEWTTAAELAGPW